MPNLPSKVFHVVDAANWASIQQNGLLSTDALLRRGKFPIEIESQVRGYRRSGIELPDGTYIRDQSPMPPTALSKCLDADLQPSDWYTLINEHVFFWIDQNRVERHCQALRRRRQIIMIFNAASLVAAYKSVAYVTPFNIGSATRKPAQRGLRTLVPVAQWCESGWAREALPNIQPRRTRHKPSELIIRQGVLDWKAHLIDTQEVPISSA
jgi:hypothetical protein